MKRKLLIYKLILLVIVLPAAVALPARWASAEPSAVSVAESEPNDAIAQANPINLGLSYGEISPVGDVDYFRLSLVAGQRAYLAAIALCFEQLDTTLTVYDSTGAFLAQNEDWPGDNVLPVFLAPYTGDYYIRVSSDGYPGSPAESTGHYKLWAHPVPPDEPDDPFAAVPIPLDSEIDSALFSPYDFDYFSVHARPGDVLRMSLTMGGSSLESGEARLSIDDAAYTYPYGGSVNMTEPGTADLIYVVPFESDYIIRVDNGIFHCEVDNTQPYHLTVERNSLYVAGNKAGNVDGVAFGANDILARDAAGAWRMVFDGEDVGLTTALGGFEFLDDGSILMSLMAARNLPGLGNVKPQDIVRFTPAQLGANTQGTFSFYLSGAQTGLTTLGERIDAIARQDDGDLLISTTGSASVPKFGGGSLSARNEDLLLFHATGPMPSTGGWSSDMDGSRYRAKFGTYDLHAATISHDEETEFEPYYHNTDLWFSLDKSYRYAAYGPDGNANWTAAPGDLIRMNYHQETYGPYRSDMWPPVSRMLLGFPKVITSLSVGPGWGD